MTDQKFKVNDIVEAFGVRGVVIEIRGDLVGVALANRYYVDFHGDGRQKDWHLEPSLKLIERPKKKVTKTVEAWANVYPNGDHGLSLSKESADARAGCERIALVKLSGSYECEE